MLTSQQNKNEKGFSLLELMIALAIFVASVGVLVAAQTAAARHQSHARNLYTATQLLNGLMSESEVLGVSATGFDETEGDFGETLEGFSWTKTVDDHVVSTDILAMAGDMGVDLEQFGDIGQSGMILDGVREVELEVFWEGRGRDGSAKLTYLHVIPPTEAKDE
jgi:prepilin-type N-terminal cleavage/methylation domain-containing protein